MYITYKSEFFENSTDRSQPNANNDETEDSANYIEYLNEVISHFNEKNDLDLIQNCIKDLKKIIFLSKESSLFQHFFHESGIFQYLIDFIQMNSISISTKIEIINIFNEIIGWFSDEDVEEIAELPIIDTIYTLLNKLDFPESNEEKESIESLKSMLEFLSSLSSRTIESRDKILEKYPRLDENPDSFFIIPFQQLFEIIKQISEIDLLQKSYITFFASLCYFNLDFEITKIVYNEFVINLFDTDIVPNYLLWDDSLPIIRYFIHNGYDEIVCERDRTFEILVEAILNGSPKAVKTSLSIINVLIDKKYDFFNVLDFSYLCDNITNDNLKISINILNLFEVLIKPDEEEVESEQNSMEHQINYPLDFLLKKSFISNGKNERINFLSQLKIMLNEGSIDQKISALQVILAILRTKQTNLNLLEISNRIVKGELISPLIEILTNDDLQASKIVCIILKVILEVCSDEQIIVSILTQINEYGEDLLSDLLQKASENNDDQFCEEIDFILSKIDEYKNSEDITSLIGRNENEFGSNDGSDDNDEIPFN